MNLILLLFSLSLNFVKSNGIILFFFDPACPHCQHEIKELINLQNSGFKVQGICNTPVGGKKSVFPVKIDEGEADFVGVESVPTIALLFVEQKKLFVLSEGYITAQDIINRIKLLKCPED